MFVSWPPTPSLLTPYTLPACIAVSSADDSVLPLVVGPALEPHQQDVHRAGLRAAGDRVGAGQPGDQAVDLVGVAGHHQQHGREQAARRVPDLARDRRAAHAEQSGSPPGVSSRLRRGYPVPDGPYTVVNTTWSGSMAQRSVTTPARPCRARRLEGNLGNDVLPSPAMTTQPGWEPRPGPTRGEPARRAPRGAAGGWPDDPARRRGGPARLRPARPSRRAIPAAAIRATGRGWSGPDDRGRGGGTRPPREPRQRPGDGPPGGSGPSPLRWIGAMSTRNALLALVAGTVIGIVGTLVAGSEPGFLLASSSSSARSWRRWRSGPAPSTCSSRCRPFAFFVGAVITGKIHDSTPLVVDGGAGGGLPQWIADIFFPMCVATILRPADRRRPLGARPSAGRRPVPDVGRPPGDPAARPRTPRGPRTDVDPWADQNATRSRAGPASGQRPLAARRRPFRPPGPRGPRSLDRSPALGRPAPAADPRDGRRPPSAQPRPPRRPRRPRPRQPAFRPRPANPGPARPGGRDRAPRPPAPQRPGPPAAGRPWDQR